MEPDLEPHCLLTAVPNELFWRIAHFLTLRDMCRLLQTSKTLNERVCSWPNASIDLTEYRRTISAEQIEVIMRRWAPFLKTVTLTQTQATDGVLALLAVEGVLQQLYAGKTDISNEGLTAVVEACPNMVTVSVPFTSVTNDGVFAVARSCAKLEQLSLRECAGVGNPSIAAIANKCRSLRTAFLEGTQVSDGGVVAMAGFCGQLRAVSLSGLTAITDKSVVRLASACPSLLMLDLFGTSITDASLVAIGNNCSQMQYLNVGMCSKVTVRGVHTLVNSCTQLVDLDISGLPVNDISLTILPQTNPHLKRLNISRCAQLSAQSIACLANLSLTLLRVRGMRSLTNEELIPVLSSSRALETLDMSLCTVDSQILVYISKHCPTIRRVYVDCTAIDNEGVVHLISHSSSTLEHLSVIGCTQVTVECITEIQSQSMYARLVVAGPVGDEFDLPWI